MKDYKSIEKKRCYGSLIHIIISIFLQLILIILAAIYLDDKSTVIYALILLLFSIIIFIIFYCFIICDNYQEDHSHLYSYVVHLLVIIVYTLLTLSNTDFYMGLYCSYVFISWLFPIFTSDILWYDTNLV